MYNFTQATILVCGSDVKKAVTGLLFNIRKGKNKAGENHIKRSFIICTLRVTFV
jgi:hypothetical protein